MKFSCGKCGRSYVADEEVRGRAFRMICKGCGNPIVVSPAVDGPRSRDGTERFPPAAQVSTTAPLSGFDLEPLPQETDPALHLPALGAAPAAARNRDPFAAPGDDSVASPGDGRLPFDPFADLPPEPPEGEGALDADVLHGEPVPGQDETEAVFADLARELGQSGERSLRGYRTGELPLVPGETGDLTPTPPAPAPGAAPAAAAEDVPEPAAAVAPPKRSLLAPLLGAAAVLVAGGFGVSHLLSGAPPAQEASSARPAAAAQRSVPAAPAVNSPRAEAIVPPVREPAPAQARLPEKPETAPGAPVAEPRAGAKPGAAQRPPPARKKAVREPVRSARAVAEPAAPAPGPPAASERPLVAIAPRLAPPPSALSPGEVRPSVPAPQPELAPAPSTPELPPLDDARVEATFASAMGSLEACVTAARVNEPALALGGRTVTLTMTLNPSGRVLYPTLDDAELSATELGRCIKRETGKIQFPPFGGDPVRVRKPITLR